MKTKNILKGFVKLLLAAFIVSGTVMAFSSEAKAAGPATVSYNGITGGGLEYTVSGNGLNLNALEIKIGDKLVANNTKNADKIKIADGTVSLTSTDIVNLVAANGGLVEAAAGQAYASGNFSITATASDGSTVSITGTATAPTIYTLSIPATPPACVSALNLTKVSGDAAVVTGATSGKKVAYGAANSKVKIEATKNPALVSDLKWSSTNTSLSTAGFTGYTSIEYTFGSTADYTSTQLTPSGSVLVYSASPGITFKPGTTAKFTASIEPADSSVTGITYSWSVKNESGVEQTLKNKTTNTVECKFSKKGTYTVTLSAIKGSTTVATKSGSIYVDNEKEEDTDVKIPSTIYLIAGETAKIVATGPEDTFTSKDDVDWMVGGDDDSKYLDPTKIKCVGYDSSKGKSATLQIENKGVENTSGDIKLIVSGGGQDSNEASVKIYKKPQSTKAVNTGTDQSATFYLPPGLSTVNTSNMLCSGYKVVILDSAGSNILKKSDFISTTSTENTVALKNYWSLIQDVATGDSFTFKVAIQPCGKTSGNSDEKTEAKTTDDKDYISGSAGPFTVYRLNLSSDPGITVVPNNGKYWGFADESVEIKATGAVACWLQNGTKIAGTEGKTSYTHKFSSTTANNVIKAAITDTGAAAGGADADANGKDKVPKTAESNAPIFLIIVLVFAAMGGGYALYLQLKPATVNTNKKNDKY